MNRWGLVEFELTGKCVNFQDLNQVTEGANCMAEKVDTLEQEVEQLRAMLQQAEQQQVETSASVQQQAPRAFDIAGQDERLATTACSTWDMPLRPSPQIAGDSNLLRCQARNGVQ